MNDLLKVASLDFPFPFIWSSWTEVTSTQSLNAGLNKIRLTAIGNGGADIDEIRVSAASGGLTAIEGARDGKQNGIVLHQNYPNPFKSLTVIEYTIPKEASVSIKVYDPLGRVVTSLVDEKKQTGHNKIVFDGRNLSSGTYFYRIHAGDFVEIKKLILMK